MIAAIVLAAGLARRMGRQKLLLDLDGKPLVRWSVEALLPHVDDVVVVTGHEASAVRGALADLPVRFAHNETPDRGQGSSIAVGASALADGTRATFVALGDQPRVPSAVTIALLDAFAWSRRPIVAPVYQGVQGTPVLFGADVLPELAALTGDTGARAIVAADPERVERVAFDFPMPLDVDTPEDYARLE